MILLLGPNKPPFEYIANLQKIVQNENNESLNKILDQDFYFAEWTASLLDNKKNETEGGGVNNSYDLSMWELEWEANYKEVILREKKEKKRGSTAVNTKTSYAFKLIFDNNNGRW